MNDHTDPTTPEPIGPDPIDPAADERIDALARSAGSELRRPAPEAGMAAVTRAKRRRDVVRATSAGAAVVALVAVGAVVIGNRSDDTTRVPTTENPVEVVDTDGPTTTPAPDTDPPDTDPTETDPPTTDPPTTVPVPANAAGDPTELFVTQDVGMSSTEMTVVDPTTGDVIDTRPVDTDASRAAQDALRGRTSMSGTQTDVAGSDTDFGYFTMTYQVGGIGYVHSRTYSEMPSLADLGPESRAQFDDCGQGELRVDGADAGGLPTHASRVVLSADGRSLLTMSSTCTGGDQIRSVQLFDATDPSVPGVTLAEFDETDAITSLGFSPDSRFVAFTTSGLQVFDTATGQPVQLALGDCDVFTTKWTEFMGPWVGGSIYAVQETCPNGMFLVAQDVSTGERMRRELPEGTPNYFVEVDHAHVDRPTNLWVTGCASSSGCWVGQGNGPLTAIADAGETSFLPLGFRYGG